MAANNNTNNDGGGGGSVPRHLRMEPHSPESGVSSFLSTPSTSQTQRRNLERVNAATLADLAADTPITPVRLMHIADEEERLDELAIENNPGADDSEDEDDTDPNTGNNLAAAFNAAALDRTEHDIDNATALEDAFVIGLLEDFGLRTQPAIPGAPLGWKPPSAPDGWQRPAPKTARGEPEFDTLDNPGKWTDFVYRPRFETGKGSKYLHHSLPTGATVVPKDATGKRTVGGWEFHYSGYKNQSGKQFRNGATKENVFPEARQGSLDGDVLRGLGLNAQRMRGDDGLPDSLFFYQLLLPMHDTTKTVAGDPRVPYYQEVAKYSLLYAVSELGLLTSGYGTYNKPATFADFLHWDGSIVMDGVLGGSAGAFFRRFNKQDTGYCEHIANTMSKERWHHLKRVYKLCNNRESAKRGEEGYDPAYKYDFIFATIIKNINALTKKANDDQCIDETTFPFNGFGEPGASLISKIMNKPGVTKGAQLVLCSDVGRLRPRAYIHRHNKHTKLCSLQGPNEIRLLHAKLKELMQGNNKIFNDPHSLFLTADNYFSGEQAYSYVAEENFGCCFTNRRDRLPKEIPAKYLQKEKGFNSANERPRAARFMPPIVATKTVDNGSVIQLVSFQSTGSCNLMIVNGLNSCQLYADTKARGRGRMKRQWGIEMNEARRLYLSSYNVIDRLDHLVQSCRMGYRTWKYWHAGMTHAKAIAVVVAYDMYLECCEGRMQTGEWYLYEKQVVSFHQFRQKLAIQMLQYNPRSRQYPGDEQFRISTQQHKSRRSASSSYSTSSRSNGSSSSVVSSSATITSAHLQHTESRCCEDLTKLKHHLASVVPITNGGRNVCVVCGEKTAYHKCTICGKALHMSTKKTGREVPCFFDYHDTTWVGLTREDFNMLRGNDGNDKRKKDWSWPTVEQQSEHADKIRRLMVPSHPPAHPTQRL